MHFMLRFDTKLDADRLRRSLERLLERQDGWRKLGGRLRRNASGKLDYHVPAKYTIQRPAITYYHESHDDIRIMQHPLAAHIPKAKPARTHGPRIVARGEDFVSLMRRKEDPSSFEDYVDTDTPVLGLHIVTFRDATLVCLRGSHLLFDAMGRKELLDAWSLTLQGRDDEVRPLVEQDPMASLGAAEAPGKSERSTAPIEQYKHAAKQLGLRQQITLGLRQLFDMIHFRRQVKEDRIVCVPKAYFETLRRDALAALEPQQTKTAASHDGEGQRQRLPPKAFLSDGDVLCAWWSRHIIASRLRNAYKSGQTVCIMNMMGLRGLLAQAGLMARPTVVRTNREKKDSAAALVANALVTVSTFLASRELLRKPLGHVAAMLRQSLQELGTWPQVEAFLRIQRAPHDKLIVTPALFGDAGMHLVVCTNWIKAGFFDVDFSAAIVSDEDGVTKLGGGRQKPESPGPATARLGKPTNVQMHTITDYVPPFLVSPFQILGKDAYGNYWIRGTLREEYWPKVEQSLLEEALLEHQEAH
ncbi:Ribosomal lysine N-methyltransferase 4 [Apiospora arundinis]